jgi:hypothetical protein
MRQKLASWPLIYFVYSATRQLFKPYTTRSGIRRSHASATSRFTSARHREGHHVHLLRRGQLPRLPLPPGERLHARGVHLRLRVLHSEDVHRGHRPPARRAHLVHPEGTPVPRARGQPQRGACPVESTPPPPIASALRVASRTLRRAGKICAISLRRGRAPISPARVSDSPPPSPPRRVPGARTTRA